MSGGPRQWDTYALVGWLLRIGVALSVAVLLLGLMLAAVRGEQASLPPSIDRLPSGIGALQSSAILSLGVLVLIFTPIARVVFTVFAFGKERNKEFVLVAVIVLVNLTIGFALGVT
jgi:uncharacterized membrane protein